MEVIGGVLLLYLLSDLLFRFLGLGAYAQGSRRSPRIALTFDDGPSERTEALLHLLKAHDVRATFFLTGKRAEARPDLVRRLREEGHQVEAHGYWHAAPLLLSPYHEWLHIRKSPGAYYRPPHGLHTPFTRLFARLLGKRVALWDTESKDWLDLDVEELSQRLLYYLRPGSVVLLHDGPERTLKLLERVLPELLRLGYQPVTLDELAPKPLSPRLALLRGLQGFEERYNQAHRVVRAGLGPFDLFRLEKKRLPWDLPGFPRGTWGFELHLESHRAMELSPLEAIRLTRESLKKVAPYLEADPEVRLLFGASYLAEGGRLFGFHTHPLPLPEALLPSLAGAWFSWLYRGEFPRRLVAQVGYIGREEFLRRFPASASGKETLGSPPPPT